MIVLCKNFNAFDYVVVTPVAELKENRLAVITEESKTELFPNNGKIFTPNIFQKVTVGNFMLYELEPSTKYYKDLESSNYYTVKQAKSNNPLLEIYDLEESYENETHEIIKIIRFGFSNKVEMLPEILLRTSDNYLLGPFRSEYDLDKQYVHLVNDFEIDKYFLPVYSNINGQMGITTYFDEFDGIERKFSLSYPNKKEVVGKLDIAPDEYIIREAIRFIRGHEEFGDITRRVSRGINDWLKKITFSESYNISRLEDAVELLREISPEIDEDSYKDYSTELLSLPSFKNEIRKKKEEQFQQEYEKFQNENKLLFSENENLKIESSEIKNTISTQRKKLEQLKNELETYSQFMISKKESMEEEVLEQYFQQLVNLNMSNGKNKQVTTFITKKDSSEELKVHKDVEILKKDFKHNLKQFGERDVENIIFDYCLMAIKFNQPLFLVGESSFILANIIQKTFSAQYSETVIPDMENFNLNVLDEIINKQTSYLNFTNIHNVHVSSASLNLTGFIKAYELQNNNNKVIFTFDSFEESRFILEQMKSYLILDVSHKSFSPSPFVSIDPLKHGQIDSEILAEYIQPITGFEESMEELIEAIENSGEIENIENSLKNSLKKLVYVNQVQGKTEKSMRYFPFLLAGLREDLNG